MLPGLSANITGGAGGDAKSGDSRLDNSFNVAFGGFSVGKGQAEGGTATQTPSSIPWGTIAIAGAVLLLGALWLKRKG